MRIGPLIIRIDRCSVCKRPKWPGQELINDDPECSNLVHHECHHRYIERLFGSERYERDVPEDYWKRMLDCEHSSEGAVYGNPFKHRWFERGRRY